MHEKVRRRTCRESFYASADNKRVGTVFRAGDILLQDVRVVRRYVQGREAGGCGG